MRTTTFFVADRLEYPRLPSPSLSRSRGGEHGRLRSLAITSAPGRGTEKRSVAHWAQRASWRAVRLNWVAGGYQVIAMVRSRAPRERDNPKTSLPVTTEQGEHGISVSSRGEAEYDRGGSLVGRTLMFIC